MKTWLKTGLGAALVAAVMTVSLAPASSEAKRLGGGKSLGMQRSAPPQAPAATPHGPPATPAANPGNAAAPMAGAAAAAAAPKRSWMGPIAGLAAGLGIAALMSHLGMGEAFGNFLMLALLAVVAVVAVRWLAQRFGRRGATASPGLQFAGAGFNGSSAGAFGAANRTPVNPAARAGQAALPVSAATGSVNAVQPAGRPGTADALPAGFDTAGFERIAKMIFIRLQAANDKADLNDLRSFTTPEMFAAIRVDLQDRGAQTQQTDVAEVNAQVIELSRDAGRQVVSVRFHGLIREDLNTPAVDFDEVWHLVKPEGAADSAWAISGIQQRDAVPTV